MEPQPRSDTPEKIYADKFGALLRSGEFVEAFKLSSENFFQDVEREQSKNSNSWLSCVNTQLGLLLNSYKMAHEAKQIPDNKYDLSMPVFQYVKSEVERLNKDYSKKDDDVDGGLPNEEKEKIINFLNKGIKFSISPNDPR